MQFELAERPAKLSDCNCSACRRFGAIVASGAAMADPRDIEGIPIRRFDGADTWRYLD